MEHLAIMKKSWDLIPKILSREKTIETRWYKSKRAPWDKIKIGEKVYFKDSGMPVNCVAEVDSFKQIIIENEEQHKKLIKKIWKPDLVNKKLLPNLIEYAKGKRYCVIVYLKNPKEVKPFGINKSGFGLQAAWISANELPRV